MGAQLERFRSWMIARGYAKLTVDSYVSTMAKLLVNPAAVQRAETTHRRWRENRAAAVQWETFAGDSEPWEEIRLIPGPRKPPPRAIHIPTLEEWLRLGRDAWRKPGALGAVLWVLMYSGLRISDVLNLTRSQVEEGVGTGRVAELRTKSSGGRGSRDWLVAPLVRPGLVRLLSSGAFRYVWQTVGVGALSAGNALRRAIPRPYTPHSFRHASCSYLVALGVKPAVAMRLTGHSSLSAFSRYVNASVAVAPSAVAEAQALLTRAIAGAAKPKDSK